RRLPDELRRQHGEPRHLRARPHTSWHAATPVLLSRHMDPAADARLNALLKGKDCMEPFDDPHILQAQIINILFDLIPAATRAALLLRWEDAPGGPEDFQSSMYGKRAGEPKRFRVSKKALEFVYTYREPYISTNENDGKPPCICAPLKRAGW